MHAFCFGALFILLYNSICRVILVLLCSINSIVDDIDDIMVHPNRGVVSHAVNVKQEQEEISLLSAQVTGGGGRRTASLKTKGRMIQLKLKIIYNKTQNKDDVVVLNKQYPPRSDKNGSFRGHDEEFSSWLVINLWNCMMRMGTKSTEHHFLE